MGSSMTLLLSRPYILKESDFDENAVLMACCFDESAKIWIPDSFVPQLPE